jgi:hypothetical protein
MPDDSLYVDWSIPTPGGLILQVVVSAPAQCTVAWGDGAVETVAATSSTPHTYAKAGNYRVNVTGANGLSQSFGVTVGSPMPAWDATKVRDKLEGPVEDAAVIGRTTGRVG